MKYLKCTKCKEDKEVSFFSIRSKESEKIVYRSQCKECVSKANLERYYNRGGKEGQAHRARKFNLKKYGMSIDDYDKMLEEQGGKCLICSSEDVSRTNTSYRLFVDHCHATGKVRGLLCHHCNAGLGHFKDSVELLQKAIGYLHESRG